MVRCVTFNDAFDLKIAYLGLVITEGVGENFARVLS